MVGGSNSKNKIYKSDMLLGIEKRTSPLFVKENRASFMRNLIYSDGILKKRQGFKEIYRLTDDFDIGFVINGIYQYKNKEIFHAGNYLFCGNEKLENCYLPNYKSYGFENGNLLYIVCYKNLYVFDGEKVTDIYDSEYSYVPTTKSNISPIDKELSEVIFESANLLTSKRKNTLIGVNETHTKYVLDGAVDREKPLKITTKMRVSSESQEENVASYNAIYNEAKRLNTDNMAKVMGISEENANRLFSGEGVDVNLSVISEIDIFLKSPIKITSALFKARGGTGIPRMTFLCNGEDVYDTLKVSEESNLDLTSQLKDQVIDEIRFFGNYSIGIIDEVNIFGKQLYEGYVEITHKVDNFQFNESIRPYLITDTSGKELTLSQNLKGTFSAGCTVHIEEGLNGQYIIAFNFINVSDSPTNSNITVEYSVVGSQRLICSLGEVCKTDTGKDILALSDGKNLYLSSNKCGFSYMPTHLKTEFEKITSICAKEGMMICVFSENTASSVEISTKDGETDYALKGHSLQGGAVNHSSTKTVNGDILSLSSDGIFGSVGNEVHRTRRGENIKSMLPKNLENAVAIEHNGLYLLFIEGGVYVADTRFKNYENNRLDSSFEYEWWYFDGINATCVSKINGEIYIGRDDGRIVKFYDGFCDLIYRKIKKGSYLFDKNNEGVSVIYIDKTLGIGTYDTVLMSNCYSVKCVISQKSVYDNKTTLHIASNDLFDNEGSYKIYPEMEVYLKRQDGVLVKAKCVEVDGFTRTLTVDIGENSDVYVAILTKIDNERYKLEEENDYFVFLDKYGNQATFENTENANVVLEIKVPVSVEYESAPLLRNEEYKYLYEICVDLTKESEGVVTLEYETDKIKRQSDLEYEKNLDFNSFDFNGLSFNSSLKKSHKVRTFERNFEYVILRIKHQNDSDFGLKGFGFRCG